MNHDHDTIERVARELCDGRMGLGHFDRAGTKRAHWRMKARLLLAVAHSSAVATGLFRACGWPL